MQQLHHLHLIARADLAAPPTTAAELNSWLFATVKAVDMDILVGPLSVFCPTPGNEGVTGFVCIETSHISAHVWHLAPVPFIQFDVYSCKNFNPFRVFQTLDKFGVRELNYTLVDRNTVPRLVQRGAY